MDVAGRDPEALRAKTGKDTRAQDLAVALLWKVEVGVIYCTGDRMMKAIRLAKHIHTTDCTKHGCSMCDDAQLL